MTEQRRLAAIVSADVAGYLRLMGRDKSGTLAALNAIRLGVALGSFAFTVKIGSHRHAVRDE